MVFQPIHSANSAQSVNGATSPVSVLSPPVKIPSPLSLVGAQLSEAPVLKASHSSTSLSSPTFSSQSPLSLNEFVSQSLPVSPQTQSAQAMMNKTVTSMFIQANPSFFEWTRPELNRDSTEDRLDEDAEYSRDNVDLLLWNSNLSCIKEVLTHDHVFFIFASSWLSLVNSSANTLGSSRNLLTHPSETYSITAQYDSSHTLPAAKKFAANQAAFVTSPVNNAPFFSAVLWELVPGYFLLLHSILRRLILEPVEIMPEFDFEDSLDDTEALLGDQIAQTNALTAQLKEEHERELLLRQQRAEAVNDVRNLVLCNLNCRNVCLTWFVELAIRHTSLYDNKGVEKNLDTLDAWFNAHLEPQLNHRTHSLNNSARISPVNRKQITSRSFWLAEFGSQLFYQQMSERSSYGRLLESLTALNGTMANSFPAGFCTSTLIRALSLLLHQEHFQLLLKALTFVYMHSGHLYGPERQEWLDELVFHPLLFPKLFLHWCSEVRRVFMYIILYRICRDGRCATMLPGEPHKPPPMTTVLIEGHEFAQVTQPLGVLLGFLVVLLPFSLWVFGRAVRRAKREGSLIQY